MSEELKQEEMALAPCPFCRGKDGKVLIIGGLLKALCPDCKASTGLFNTKAEAITAWNHRPTEDAETQFNPDYSDDPKVLKGVIEDCQVTIGALQKKLDAAEKRIEKWYHQPAWFDVLKEIKRLTTALASAEGKIIKMGGLLLASNCPCCDGSGGYYNGDGTACQCQWCDETNNILALNKKEDPPLPQKQEEGK